MAMKYLNEEQLAGFDKYKYSSVDTSPVSKYITHPFWNQVVKLVPLWVAPNLLTFISFMLLVYSVGLVSYYDKDFLASSRNHPESPPLPAWVWIACGLCQFLSHTLDGIDGKQARRTQTSSPLGELFDHGVDSWSTMFLPIPIYSIFSRDENDYGESVYVMYLILLNVQVCFILSHWEKYNTGILFLPWGFDIAQLSMTALYIATGIFGYEIWKGVYFDMFEFRKVFLVTLMFGTFVATLPLCFYNVYSSYKDKSGKLRTFYEAMLPLLVPTILFGLTTVWVFYSPTKILEREPRLIFWLLGTVFSNVACRLIVSCMSSTRTDTFNVQLIPLAAVVFISLGYNCGIYEVYMAWALTIFVTLAHLHYCIFLVKQMCEHFNIYCFSIKKKPMLNNKHKPLLEQSTHITVPPSPSSTAGIIL
ncbi:ethanolaminephosphotransferase 1-like [Glandiceps talaboti]